jgi:hypothetical protein
VSGAEYHAHHILGDFDGFDGFEAYVFLVMILSFHLMVFVVLGAFQLGPKPSPELQDKFVFCHTEGKDSQALRRTIDSLAALNCDDRRKLIFIMYDSNIIGSGNDRTTPRIILKLIRNLTPNLYCSTPLVGARRRLTTTRCTLDCTSLKAMLSREFSFNL